ncbi:DUF4355 domain-containing protein, partial [Staphylococcus pseudintermedius]
QQIQDELTEKQKEADKLRKMNAEQKHQYELEKAEKERDDYKQNLSHTRCVKRQWRCLMRQLCKPLNLY